MRTFAFDFQKTRQMFDCPTKRDAVNMGNGYLIVQGPEDVQKSRIPLDELVKFYNYHNTLSPIKSFRDRLTAAKKLVALAEAKAKKITPQQELNLASASETVATTPKKPTIAPVAQAAKEEVRKGRTSSFKGKKIHLSIDLKANPRREGTHGHKSMEIVINSKNGLTYEEYIAQGGRRQDLAWDLEHGNVWID
jgi:hypothetical protein